MDATTDTGPDLTEYGEQPMGEPVMRSLAMPADTNPSGDIFGGWLMSEMDLAGAVAAQWRARGRVATVGVDGMNFHLPVKIGDVVSCYAEVTRVGRTSLVVKVEAWVRRRRDESRQMKVTEGIFHYVALDSEGHKREVPAG